MVTPEEIARAMAVHSDEPTSDLSGNGKLPTEDDERDAGPGVAGDVKEKESPDPRDEP